MRTYDEYIGRKFGRLTVIGITREKNKCWFICNCDCGKRTRTYYYTILNGTAKSCGCYKKEVLQALLGKYDPKDKRLACIWKGMRQRCFNEKFPNYKDYGGRGITVCDEWNDFNVFKDWAYANGYTDGLTIERVDNNNGYSPDNCRWADMKTQNNNKRNNTRLTLHGKTKTLSMWCDEYGMKYSVVYQRVHTYGWDLETALKTPLMRRHFFVAQH